MKITLVIEDALLRKAKKRAAELGMTLSAFAEQLLRDALAPKGDPARRVVLPAFGQGLPKYDHSVAELRALEGTLSEWESAHDEDAYRDL